MTIIKNKIDEMLKDYIPVKKENTGKYLSKKTLKNRAKKRVATLSKKRNN